MLTRLRLERFKNFGDAELQLGPFTVLVGTNASGKSNVREAFRFLHGIARGYTLAEIIGEKWVEGGVLQWRGIRGGAREIAYRDSTTFAITADLQLTDKGQPRTATYRIEVEKGDESTPPRVVAERLVVEGRGQFVFDSHPRGGAAGPGSPLYLAVELRKEARKGFHGPTIQFMSNQPVLTQVLTHPDVSLPTVKEMVRATLAELGSMRFLDLTPDAMRMPSVPGQTILGDRGENLSSVLQAICQDDRLRKALLRWVKELTPLDAIDFEFTPDVAGRILVTLVEENGQRTSAYSASDGTLRYLAMLGALLGPKPAEVYVLEELETGIHPTRVHLLVQLIEQRVKSEGIQVVATTHSPQLLAVLESRSLEHASLVYRLAGHPGGQIQRILDIPDAKQVIEKQNVGTLHASGWLEDMAFFNAEGEGEDE